MTQPDDITVSLEMARKLKEAGWPQYDNGAAGFFWLYPHYIVPFFDDEYHPKERDWSLKYWESGMPHHKCIEIDHPGFLRAPSAEEILRRLPRRLAFDGELEGKWICVNSDADRKGWKIGYLDCRQVPVIEDDTLANAAAAMWCYLAENGLLPKADEAA